jgi:threonine/homoserine/homoserine lactone efflux protein
MKTVLIVLFFPVVLLYLVGMYVMIPIGVIGGLGIFLAQLGSALWIVPALICYPLAAYLIYVGVQGWLKGKKEKAEKEAAQAQRNAERAELMKMYFNK